MFDVRWERREQRQVSRRLGAAPVEPGARPRPDLPIGEDLLPKIKHIVVLMMENHSYDNFLGLLADRGEGLALGPDGLPLAANPRQDGSAVRAHHLASTVQVERVPTQSWNVSHLCYDGGRNDGFVTSVEQFVPGADPTVPMGYWTESDLPFYYGLARTFPLADRWFCSCLGPTFPNRRFMMAGTANGLIDDLPWDLVDYPAAGTIFDHLTSNGIGWVNYHNVNPTRLLLKRSLGAPGLIAARRIAQLGRLFPAIVHAQRGNNSFTSGLYPLGLAGAVRHLRTTKQFFADADAGTLPPFSIVDPDFGDFSEENPQDIRKGESFASEVVKHVLHGKGWADTLLHLDLRRARRLLRPRAAAGGDPAGRRAGQGPGAVLAGVAAGAAAAAPARGADRAGQRRRRAKKLRPVRLPGAHGDRVPLRPARPRDQHRL